MKRECPSLFAALLVSLLVNVLLRSQTAYWPRAGLFSAAVCAPLLAGVGWLFARCWRLAADPVYKLLFGALLVYTSVLELLRLWQLADRLYPGAVTLTSVCLLVVLPVVYLRRVSALSQTAYAVLCLLVLATVAMLASVLPRLCIVNLQTSALTQSDFSRRRQRPADALPGIPAARALARAGQAWPPYAAAAGRVGAGV